MKAVNTKACLCALPSTLTLGVQGSSLDEWLDQTLGPASVSYYWLCDLEPITQSLWVSTFSKWGQRCTLHLRWSDICGKSLKNSKKIKGIAVLWWETNSIICAHGRDEVHNQSVHVGICTFLCAHLCVFLGGDTFVYNSMCTNFSMCTWLQMLLCYNSMRLHLLVYPCVPVYFHVFSKWAS